MGTRTAWTGLICGLLLAAWSPAMAQLAPQEARAGDWAVKLTRSGPQIRYRDTLVSKGSYVTVFRPGYEGSLLTLGGAWDGGSITRSQDGSQLEFTGALPEGAMTYRVSVTPDAVRVVLAVKMAPEAKVGPTEHSIFQFPPELVAGGLAKVVDVAGATVDEKRIPDPPERGAITSSGDEVAINASWGKLVIGALHYSRLYLFDARVPDYREEQQGVWAFGGIPTAPGEETTAGYELRVFPPEPEPVEGSVTIAPTAPATAIATLPDPTPREKLAADELSDYLFRICGKGLATIEIADGHVPPGVIAVGRLAVQAGLIGQQELDQVARDGYIVKVAQGRGAVCGWRDLGTIYGAYALLGKLGVRFYAPSCEVVPHVEHLVMPQCDLRMKPRYEFRNLSRNLKLGHTPGDDMGNPREIGEPGSLVHAAAYLLPFDNYGEEHPEYFALQKDGKRLHRDPNNTRFDVHLCLSNPDVRRISAERMLHLIEQQPQRTFFGVSQGDGFAWCQCEQCKALDAVPGVEMTDRLLDYVNYIAREVAKKYPDKRILTLAYTNATSPPPRRVLPEPNVMVQYCPYPPRTGCHSHDFTCERNKVGYEDLKGWLAACPDNMYIFDYPRGYQTWYEPFGSFWAMRWKLDTYAVNGVRGIFYCGTPENFRDLFIYVQSRLLWEPNLNVEPLIDEFMAAYYGPAAPYVRQYFDFMHDQVRDRQFHQMCEGANPGLATAEYAEKALGLFERAQAVVAQDRARLYRVRREKFCVLFADINERNPVNGKLVVDEDTFARRLAEFLQIGRTMRVSALARREQGVVANWLYRVARMRLTARPWYADRLIDRMAADPLGSLQAEQQLYSQTQTAEGWRIELDGFRGCPGPSEYSHQCPPKQAVWIYGKSSKTPQMWALLHLDEAPVGSAKLRLTAQDDDKPGAVRVRITINGKEIHAGPNPFKQLGWSSADFAIPQGVLVKGANEIRFATMDESVATDAGWFMLAQCEVVVGR